MAIMAKRNVMRLYSDYSDPYCHQVRIVLAEKGINFELHPVDSTDLPLELLELNPYGTIPTLVDRDLVLYQPRIIMEYLDERFPHPPLMPVIPVARAEYRIMMYRIVQDWFCLMHKIENGTEKEAVKARQQLHDSLVSLAPIFASHDYFLSDDFTMVDCTVMPLLWRLPQLGIVLPESAQAVKDYAKRGFARDSFQASLTDVEREIEVV